MLCAQSGPLFTENCLSDKKGTSSCARSHNQHLCSSKHTHMQTCQTPHHGSCEQYAYGGGWYQSVVAREEPCVWLPRGDIVGGHTTEEEQYTGVRLACLRRFRRQRRRHWQYDARSFERPWRGDCQTTIKKGESLKCGDCSKDTGVWYFAACKPSNDVDIYELIENRFSVLDSGMSCGLCGELPVRHFGLRKIDTFTFATYNCGVQHSLL